MATLYITELDRLPLDQMGRAVAAPMMPPIAEQTKAIGGTSAASNAFDQRTRFIQIHTDAICSVAFGESPVATTSNQRMAAGETRFYGVQPGHKVAVISNT